MTGRHVPTVQGRRLAGELRRLRHARGLSRAEAARRAGVSTETVRRGEDPAQCRLEPNNVWRLAQVYGVTDEAALGMLDALARGARQPGWWQEYDLSANHAAFVALEGGAAAKCAWEPSLIPGLLQTPEYARAVIESGPDDLDAGQVGRLVRLRTERQKALLRELDPLVLHAVTDESVIRRPVGSPPLMRDQLAHVLHLAEMPNVTVQVVPAGAGAHPAMTGPFAVLSYPDESDVLYEERLAGAAYLEDEAALGRARRAFSHLERLALPARESMSLIAEVAVSM